MARHIHVHFDDRSEERVKLEIETTAEFGANLARFLAQCALVGAQGHSFGIEADKEMAREYELKGSRHPRTGMDGDGADRIFSVKLNGQEIKPPKDWKP